MFRYLNFAYQRGISLHTHRWYNSGITYVCISIKCLQFEQKSANFIVLKIKTPFQRWVTVDILPVNFEGTQCFFYFSTVLHFHICIYGQVSRGCKKHKHVFHG
jgi:hypothetical protein